MIKKYFDLKKINLSNFNLFLFYGKNDGLQNEVINDIFTSNFKGSVNKYDENEFINNYETVATELLTKSLFEKEKIISEDNLLRKLYKINSNFNFKSCYTILRTHRNTFNKIESDNPGHDLWTLNENYNKKSFLPLGGFLKLIIDISFLA